MRSARLSRPIRVHRLLQTSISVVPPAFVNLILSVPKDFDPAKILPLPQLREAIPKPKPLGPSL